MKPSIGHLGDAAAARSAAGFSGLPALLVAAVMLCLGAAASAQEKAQEAPKTAQEETKKTSEETKKAPEEPKKEEEQTPPAAAPEEVKPVEWGPFTVRSSVEIGYRWKSSYGSEDMYRSQINLGRGPRLLSSSVSMEGSPHSGKLWDRLNLSINNWGGDPYNTVRLRVEKSDVYLLDFQYQNIQYFNNIPTFSNPLLASGVLLSQHRRDTGRHLIDSRLTLWPTALIHPYVGFSRSRLQGRALTTMATGGDEFALSTDMRESSDEYRFGVEFGRTHFGGFVEQAFRHSKEDWRLTPTSGLLGGNNPGSTLGIPVFLTDLLRNDHNRGNASITRAFLRWAPIPAVQMSGHASYINADQSFRQDLFSSGSFVSVPNRRIYPSERDAVGSTAQMPGLLAGGDIVIQPFSRLTLLDSYQVYQFHSDGGGSSASTLFNSLPLSGPQTPETVTLLEPLDSRIAFNTRRNTLEGTIRWNDNIGFRLGYRYQFQEAKQPPKETAQGERPAHIESNQHMPLAGIDFKIFSGLQLTAEFEKGYTDAVFYRTMPKNFTRFRVRARSQLGKMVRATAFMNLFDHRNGLAGVDLSGHNRGYGFSFSLAPSDRISLTMDYQKSDVDSNLRILVPQTLTAARSFFADDANYGSFFIDLRLMRGVLFNLGYSVVGTTGTLPVNFHQPFAELSIPVAQRVSWIFNWRYYGYNEKASSLQDYRTHLYGSGLLFHF